MFRYVSLAIWFVLGSTALVADASGRHFVDVFEKNAPHNESTKTTGR
jgi:hypothetical protein